MASVSELVRKTEMWFDQQIDCIGNYPFETHRIMILLSIVDAFAQENGGNVRGNQKKFANFIKEYSKKHKMILEKVCPVTLYYSNFISNDKETLNLYVPEIYYADSEEACTEAYRLLAKLSDREKNDACLKHSYAGLIYQMRNKLSHEFAMLTMPINFQNETNNPIPNMACGGENGYWRLHIPEQFVKNVAIDAVKHYLSECLTQDRAPFGPRNAKDQNSWYYKIS